MEVGEEATWLRRSQASFERYRQDAAQYAHDSVLPGMLADAYRWQTYFQVTIERARMLMGLPYGRDVLGDIDLTRTDWCQER